MGIVDQLRGRVVTAADLKSFNLTQREGLWLCPATDRSSLCWKVGFFYGGKERWLGIVPAC